MRTRVRALASLSGLRIRHCRELRCRSLTQLGSRVAVAVAWAGSRSSNSTPSLGTFICHTCSLKKAKKKKNKNKNKNWFNYSINVEVFCLLFYFALLCSTKVNLSVLLFFHSKTRLPNSKNHS